MRAVRGIRGSNKRGGTRYGVIVGGKPAKGKDLFESGTVKNLTARRVIKGQNEYETLKAAKSAG